VVVLSSFLGHVQLCRRCDLRLRRASSHYTHTHTLVSCMPCPMSYFFIVRLLGRVKSLLRILCPRFLDVCTGLTNEACTHLYLLMQDGCFAIFSWARPVSLGVATLLDLRWRRGLSHYYYAYKLSRKSCCLPLNECIGLTDKLSTCPHTLPAQEMWFSCHFLGHGKLC